MITALTGTPGTGKTSVAEELEERGYRTVDLTEFVKERGAGEEGEKEFEVNVPAMVDALQQELDGPEKTILEGHLAHHFPADYCVVLRTRPEVLKKRLEERGYPGKKVEENVESEALDVILQEAVEKQENVIEVDTTHRDRKEVAEEIERRVEEGDTGYGNVDWSGYL